MPRIPIRPRVYTDQPDRASPETRFFAKFARYCLLDRLSVLHKPSWQRPTSTVRGPPASDQQDPPAPYPNGVHGQRGVSESRGHGKATRSTDMRQR
jgi:hypothetical protein